MVAGAAAGAIDAAGTAPAGRGIGSPGRQRRAALAGAIGNLLEWYDFAAYGYFGAILGRAFFPAEDPATSLLAAFAVFAAAFFMRPFGGIVFGHIGDRHGRRAALVLSAALMTLSTFAIGCLPTYETAGLLAPVLLVVLRLGQGLSVGGEYTSSAIFLVEGGPARRRGLMGSLACLGAGGGIMAGSLVGALVTASLDPAEVAAWGWRIPFLIGIVLGAVVFLLRGTMEPEAERPVAAPSRPSPLREALATEGGAMLRAALVNLAPAAAFYVVFVYLVTFLQSEDGLPEHTAFVLNTAAMALLTVTVPLAGALSDRIGRRPLLIGLAAGLALFSWPLFGLIASRDPALILLGQAGFAVLIGGYTALMPATLVEMMRGRTRCTAMAVSFNGSIGLAGGTAPMVAAALVHGAGLPTAPGLYLAALALVSLGALLTLRDRTGLPLD